MIDNDGPDPFAPIPPGWFEFGDEPAWLRGGRLRVTNRELR